MINTDWKPLWITCPINGFNSDPPFSRWTNVKIASKVERVKITRVRTMVRSEGGSTYWLRPSSLLRKLFLCPPNLRVDIRAAGCDRLSWITLWFRNRVLNDGFTKICHPIIFNFSCLLISITMKRICIMESQPLLFGDWVRIFACCGDLQRFTWDIKGGQRLGVEIFAKKEKPFLTCILLIKTK